MVPKISIIVPIYNVENYLERCLNSFSPSNTTRDRDYLCE